MLFDRGLCCLTAECKGGWKMCFEFETVAVAVVEISAVKV